MKVHYPKLYNMAHLLALNVLLLPKDLTIILSITLATLVVSLCRNSMLMATASDYVF